jgi:hypothetical protein
MHNSVFVTASVLSSMLIGMALVSVVLTHAVHVHDGSMFAPTGIIENEKIAVAPLLTPIGMGGFSGAFGVAL